MPSPFPAMIQRADGALHRLSANTYRVHAKRRHRTPSTAQRPELAALRQSPPDPSASAGVVPGTYFRSFVIAGLAAAILAFGQPPAAAQTSAGAEATADLAAKNGADDETIVLSPFVVESTANENSYRATSTLAGTRVRTDLSDVASSISVVTSQFLKDTGATNNQTLLQYATNTEVAGTSGNYAAVGNTFVEGASEGNFAHPDSNTRVRGLDSADNTRDYFLTDIPWDAFNVGRVDLQRGPNSILFGIGSPAGIINASVNTAGFRNAYEIQNRVSSFGSVRTSADFNQVLLPNRLAIRVALLDDAVKYRQSPAFNDDKRAYGAVRWEPNFFDRAVAHTSIRVNYEHGEVEANRPRLLPPTDRITPFFAADGLNHTVYDPYYAYATGIIPGTTGTQLGEAKNPWITGSFLGRQFRAEPQLSYDALAGGATAILATSNGPSGQSANTSFAIGPTGAIDQAIGGYPFKGSGYGIATYNQFTIAANQLDPTAFQGASSGFYKSYSLTDPSIFDFYNHLLDGPNKNEWQGWNAFNLALDQTFWGDRLGLNLVYDNQHYWEGAESNGTGTAISVDINANAVNTLPWAYGTVAKYNGSGTPGTNPNAGRAFVASSGANGGSRQTDRKNLRFTVFGELRAGDFMKKSLVSDILGRHVFTGLYNRENYDQEFRNWQRYGVAGEWDGVMGTGPGPGGSGVSTVLAGTRTLPLMVYISEPLFGVQSASGLHLAPITAMQSPSGTANIQYFDSHWKWSTNPNDPSYVDPAAAWTNPTTLPSPSASTQSENPANYVGWKNGSFRILNADDGDIGSLYTGGSKLRQVNTAEGLTWQGYLWDDTIVGTFGWRRDEQRQRSGVAAISSVTGAADMDYDLAPLESKVTGISRSWGVVVHEPKAWRNKLPWGTQVSFTYSRGENTRVQTRYSFDGTELPNARGSTQDYGIVINTLNDRLQLKAVWYKTTVKDANISSTLSSESSLGATAAGVWQFTKWALGSALQGQAGIIAHDPAASGFAYLWNWAQYTDPNPALQDVNSDTFKNNPETLKELAAIKSFIDNMPDQSFWDAYGIPVNVAEVKAGHYQNAIGGWKVSNGNWEIGGNQTINGVPPTGSVDNVSKGVELELTGQLSKNWNIAINASKQTASQTALGAKFVAFVEQQAAFYASPAGDLKLWYGGDERVGDLWNRTVGAAYQFQKQTNGKLVPEMSPWRFNMVTNYTFGQGLLKGANVGGGYRWQQGHILGYALKSDFSNLDVNRPYWSKSDESFDLWAGYERKLSARILWRLQLNLRNVGQSVGLVPVSVQPDGTPALQRIREGQTWSLTNTFSF